MFFRNAVAAAFVAAAGIVFCSNASALTFCGQTDNGAHLNQPSSSLSPAVRAMHGVFQGTMSGPQGSACEAYVINVGSEKAASLTIFQGAGIRGADPGTRNTDAEIKGNKLTYENSLGWPITLTVLDPNHFRLLLHSPKTGADYTGDLARVQPEEAAAH